jgi:hypothetical protein
MIHRAPTWTVHAVALYPRAVPYRIAFFTSPMARVILISRGQASVQLKMVRQRQTPSRSF